MTRRQRWHRFVDGIVFVAFGILSSVESSLWFRWLQNKRVSAAAADPAIGSTYIGLFMAVEIALLGCYAWLVVECVRDLAQPGGRADYPPILAEKL